MTEKKKFSRLEADLRKAISGEVRFDDGSRALYATDGSNYRQTPIGVVVPRTKEDIERTVATCHLHGAPILSRGGGTSLAGQCCNAAVVMDMSKYYNEVLEIDAGAKFARVQPGIVLDELRHAAEKHGLTFGPDPATHSRCTLGGMMGNNSCGVHALAWGKTVENVNGLEVITYDGLKLSVGPTSEDELRALCAENGRRGEIYRGLRRIRDEYGDLVRKRYPKIPRRVSGYNLDMLLPEAGFDVAKALVGTESTCVTILEAKLRLVPSPEFRGLVVVGFPDIVTAAANMDPLLALKPIGCEAIDNILVENIKIKHRDLRDLELLPEGNSWLVVEIGGFSEEEKREKLAKMSAAASAIRASSGHRVIQEKEKQDRLWKVREAGLGVTASVPGQRDTWEGWEDSAVDPSQLADYLRELKQLYKKYDYTGALYGHFGQGCVHTRIPFDLVTAEGIRNYHRFTEEAADLVVRHHGSLSGEHGDGQSRAELLPKMFGPELVKAFREFKHLWDPANRMNPGKIVDAFKNTDNLRLGADYEPWDPPTHFAFPEDKGSLARAAIRCVGVGACRRHEPEGGSMCPSYMVTREEKHSTRGRARLLFEMLEGKVIPPKWRNSAVKEALDLCLSCKGCKSDCPVNVDMATYKAEFLSHYYEGHLRPRTAYAFGWIGIWAKLASLAPGLANFFTQTKVLAPLAKFLAGMHQKRAIPAFARETFRHWFARNHVEKLAEADGDPKRVEPSRVVLWTDTFTNHFHPEIARAAVEALEAGGFSVQIPKRPYCCGRPLYDYGFVPMAKRWLGEILDGMRPEIRAGLPFIFLEPSCGAVFRDELKSLYPNDPDAVRLSEQSYLLADFLLKHENYPWPRLPGKLLVQGHCHHKAVFGFQGEETALRKICADVEILDAGCCGMAGSFGFEAEHYDVSVQVGERKFLPALREAGEGTRVVASGFSCREQAKNGTAKRAMHFAEILAEARALERGLAAENPAA